MQGNGERPSSIGLVASAGMIPSNAGSPQGEVQRNPGATLRHPPMQQGSLRMVPQVQ